MIELLNDDVIIRSASAAAWALGKIGDKRAVEPLIEALKHEHVGLRATSADSLGELGDERAVEPLIELRDADKEKYVEIRARDALRMIKNKHSEQ